MAFFSPISPKRHLPAVERLSDLCCHHGAAVIAIEETGQYMAISAKIGRTIRPDYMDPSINKLTMFSKEIVPTVKRHTPSGMIRANITLSLLSQTKEIRKYSTNKLKS